MTEAAGGELYASVAVALPVRGLFTYRVDRSLKETIAPGSRVRVPFGRRKILGTVVELPAARPDADVEIRSIETVLDAARRHGVEKLLFLGSSCIYPKLAPQP
mgnify:CR=1 FL=1